MKKIWIIVVVLIIIVGGYFAWKSFFKKSPEEKAADVFEKTTKSAGAGALPELTPLANPLEKLPETNPVEKANPFKNIKTNPFR